MELDLDDSDTEFIRQVLERLNKEQDMKTAFIAGVARGVQIPKSDKEFSDREELEEHVNEKFKAWFEDFQNEVY